MDLYDASIPVLIRGLHTLAAVLDLAQQHAEAEGIDPASLIEARLWPDMLPLAGQVQRASDTSKRAAVRVAGVAEAPMADTETTFAELRARIEATVAVLETATREAVVAGTDAEVVLAAGGVSRTYTGQTYVLEFVLPNFFFHVATAYAILRSRGVPLGKRHYLGWK